VTVLPYQELWWALPELDRVRPSHWSFCSERGRVSVTAHRREEEVTYLFKNPLECEETPKRRVWQFQNASLRPFLRPDEGGEKELVLVKKDGRSFLYMKVSHNKEIHISGNQTGIPLGSFPHPLPRRTMKYSDRAPHWWECFREAARFVGEDRQYTVSARATPTIIPLSYIHYNYRWLKASDGQRAVTLMCVDSVAFEHEGGAFNIRPTPYLLSKRSTFPFAKILGVDRHAEYLMFCAKPWYYSLPINYWPYPSATF
jgi:hypothetical protein